MMYDSHVLDTRKVLDVQGVNGGQENCVPLV